MILFKNKMVVIVNTKIYVERVKFTRVKENPKKCILDLNANWTIDYKKMNNNSVEYICNIDVEGDFPTTFVVEGVIKHIKYQENKISNELSQSILDNSFRILLNMLNLTNVVNIDGISEAEGEVKYSKKLESSAFNS